MTIFLLTKSISILITLSTLLTSPFNTCVPSLNNISIEDREVYTDKKEEPIELFIEWVNEEGNEGIKDYIDKTCREHNIPSSIVLGIIYNESRFTDSALNLNSNGTYDYGLMQLNDSTFKFLSERIGITNMEELFDSRTNILAGITLLSYHQENTGDINEALVCYQIGEGAYRRMISNGENPNQTYYNVLSYADIFEDYLKMEDSNNIEIIAKQIVNKVKGIKI